MFCTPKAEYGISLGTPAQKARLDHPPRESGAEKMGKFSVASGFQLRNLLLQFGMKRQSI